MRLSRFFLPTLKEAPSDAQIVSHQLMLRAGMIKQEAAGIYAWLPLGLKVLRKIEQIVREEQVRAGAVELLMPTLQLADLWRLLRVVPESIAPIKNGAKSWFQIGNFTLQPSEFTKIGIMMMVASIISKAGPKDQRSLREDVNLLLKIAAWTVIPLGLIVLQDAGTLWPVTVSVLSVRIVSFANFEI